MSTPIQTGWLKNNNGEKIAPKTLVSQIQENDGTSLETKLQNLAYLNEEDNEIITDVEEEHSGSVSIDDSLSTTSKNPVQNKIITEEINNISEQINQTLKVTAQELTDEQKTQICENIGVASVEYIQRIFKELKALIKSGQTDGAIAVLDSAILDLHTLS